MQFGSMSIVVKKRVSNLTMCYILTLLGETRVVMYLRVCISITNRFLRCFQAFVGKGKDRSKCQIQRDFTQPLEYSFVNF